jgi:hypothetical protein
VCGLIVAALVGLWALSSGFVWTALIAVLLALAAWAELRAARYDAAH